MKQYQDYGKKVVGYAVGGGLYVLAVSIVFGIFGGIGLNLTTDLQEFSNAVATFNGWVVLLGLLGFLVLGGLVWIFAWVGVRVRAYLGEAKEIKLGQRPFLITLIAVGAVTTVIFYGLGQVLNGISPNANLTNIETLWDAVVQFNPLLIVVAFLSISAIGYLVGRIGEVVPKIDREIPDQLKKV